MITIQKAVIARAKMCERDLDRVTSIFATCSHVSKLFGEDFAQVFILRLRLKLWKAEVRICVFLYFKKYFF